jgi:hypothetical protein
VDVSQDRPQLGQTAERVLEQRTRSAQVRGRGLEEHRDVDQSAGERRQVDLAARREVDLHALEVAARLEARAQAEASVAA